MDTIAKFAFVSSFVPGGADETPFMAAIKSLLSRDPTVGELSVLRRLLAESYSLTAAELRQQVERTADAPAKQLAAPDRADRLKKQKALYPGLSIHGPNEPSDRLVDRCVQIYEMNRLVHVPLNFCASKDDEIRNHKDKEDRLLSVDATGHIHIKNAAIKVEADLSSDLLVRFALTRRGLALEQAGLLSYELREKWAERLINSRYRELPTGYARISTQQILQADKQAFIVAADMCRAGIQLEAAGRPLDRVWDSVITHAEPFCFLCLFRLLRPPHRGPSALPFLMRPVKVRVRKVKVPEVGERGQMQECPMTSRAAIAAPPRVIPFASITSVATVSAP